MADAAATIIANAVDLPGHSAITRRPASRAIKADSDLGTTPVTTECRPPDINRTRSVPCDAMASPLPALPAPGALIRAAALFLQGDAIGFCDPSPNSLISSCSTNTPGRSGGRHPPADRRRRRRNPIPKGTDTLPDFTLRKLSILIEEVHHDGGPVPGQPHRQRAAILALCANPFAGRYDARSSAIAMETLKPLGLMMTDRPDRGAWAGATGIDAYGKGAIVGADGAKPNTARCGMCRAAMRCAKDLAKAGRSFPRR